ncbi:MAG: hypothetical protein JWM43_1840 [Acidobacteriaceae bacterium]|nr:hypothetical protein [Acidobacteriaceae bacterium]
MRSPRQSDRVLQFALPEDQHTPTFAGERLFNAPVPSDISIKLPFPKLGPRLGKGGLRAVRMSMPEAPVNEDNFPLAWEDEVRPAR